MAGSRGLSPAERDIQEVCRDRFTLYDPTCDRQVRFVIELSELSGSSPPHAYQPATGFDGHRESTEDELMAALLQDDVDEAVVRPIERHSTWAGQHPLRQPEPCTRRKEDWSDYLGKWRGGAA